MNPNVNEQNVRLYGANETQTDFQRANDLYRRLQENFPDRKPETQMEILQRDFIRGLKQDEGIPYSEAEARFDAVLDAHPDFAEKILNPKKDECLESVEKIQRENPTLSKEEAMTRAYAENPVLVRKSIRGETQRFKRVEVLNVDSERDQKKKKAEGELLNATDKAIKAYRELHPKVSYS